MPSPSAALDLLLRADAEPWDWTVTTLPVLSGRIGAAPPRLGADCPTMTLPGGGSLLAPLDRHGLPERLVAPVAADGCRALCEVVAAHCGPYLTARRGALVRRWWRLKSGRHLEAVGIDPAANGDDERTVTLELVRAGTLPPATATPPVLADAAADLAVRIAEAAYVPVEDESLPDLAAALGGRLTWASSKTPRRHIDLARPPFHLELLGPVTAEAALTWYGELRIDLHGAGDVIGTPRTATYQLAVAALTRRCGAATRAGGETCFWERENGWTVAVDRSSGVVRVRLRPPGDPPVRPPD